MYRRHIYLEKIAPFINKPIIKVITGMRRSGKSCFLEQIQDSLLQEGVKKENIISINMELLTFEFIKNYQDLNDYVLECTPKDSNASRYYLFIDEVQEIEAWEKAVLSLYSSGHYDIFITGSNAHLLSSELATLISGRYIEFPIYPLCFKEFVEFDYHQGTLEEQFQTYIKFGGLPGIQPLLTLENETFQYINAIYNTILLKDIVKRYNIRNVSTLQSISHFLFDNIGSTFSAKKIADYLKGQRINLSVETVQNYTHYLENAFLIHKVTRFDIKGKKNLEISEKYFLNDVGIRHARLGFKTMDISHLLENVIYLDLIRRGYTVNIGKVGSKEVDFVASKPNKRFYIQVAYLIESEKIKQREISAFDGIQDAYPRILLSMDTIKVSDNINGIRHFYILDFLLDKTDVIF